MKFYTDPDGFTLVEDRDMQIGSPGQRMTRVVGHPIDIYRRRFPEQTEGLDDLQVLALWHVEEVDRRLNLAGLPVTRTIASVDAVKIASGSLTANQIQLGGFEVLARAVAQMFGKHDPAQAPPRYPRPYVRRVNTEHGSHIEPPLDPSWSDLEKLRWWAAVAEVDAGITGLEVHPASSTTNGVPDRGRYSIRSRGRSGGIGTFDGAWSFLNGIVYGADIIREQHLADEVRT